MPFSWYIFKINIVLLLCVIVWFARYIAFEYRSDWHVHISYRYYIIFLFILERTLSFWRIMKNPIYVFQLLGVTAHMASIGGYFSFLSKYIYTQYNIPLWKANILVGKFIFKNVFKFESRLISLTKVRKSNIPRLHFQRAQIYLRFVSERSLVVLWQGKLISHHVKH